MGFDTNGNWTSDFYPETDRDEHIAILASKFQQLIQTDIKSGFDNCLTRDGAGKPNANLNFNGYKITNLANAEIPSDALNLGQAQAGASNYANDTSNTANAITISLDPAISSYTLGQRFYFKVANTNTLSEVSFNANGVGLCRVQMDGFDSLVAGSLKQNCIYEGVYSETGNTAEATYAGRRLQVLSQASDLASTLNHKQITNCILSAPNGVATQAGLVITLKSDVRFLIYHGLNADNTIDNIDYTTTADTTYTFAGTEAGGIYYLFADDSGVITPNTSPDRQTDKAIFAECKMESGSITRFAAYDTLELLKITDRLKIIDWSMPDYSAGISKTKNIEYTAECAGELLIFSSAGGEYCSSNLILNGTSYPLTSFDDSAPSNCQIAVRLNKGDTYEYEQSYGYAGYGMQFYPLRGAML